MKCRECGGPTFGRLCAVCKGERGGPLPPGGLEATGLSPNEAHALNADTARLKLAEAVRLRREAQPSPADSFEARWWAWWEERKNPLAERDQAQVDFVSMLNDELIALREIDKSRAQAQTPEVQALREEVLRLMTRVDALERR